MLGVRFDQIQSTTFDEKLNNFFDQKKPHLIFTPNPEMLVLADKDAEFKKILNSSDLNLVDGAGVVVMGKIFGEVVPKRITGVDALWQISKFCHENNKKIYLLGGDPGIAELAAKNIASHFSGIQISADGGGLVQKNGEYWSESEMIIQKINSFAPDVLAVAFGHKKQETWIVDHLDKLKNISIIIGVGGALDYISGSTKRAPILFRSLGLEWFFRLVRQPHRIKRIFNAVIIFPILVIRDKIKGL